MRTITLETLVRLNACDDQVELFRKLFGEKRSFRSEAACVRVAVRRAAQFNWRWAAANLLSGTAYVECREACDAARDERRKACAAAWGEYHRACATAGAVRRKACAAAYVEYHRACATSFACAWFNDGEAA